MKTVTITLTIPDGVAVDVQQQQAAGTSSPAAAAASESWPAGLCPKHQKPWTEGKYGPYCTAKDEQGNERGYCSLKPGIHWNGKQIP